MNGSVSRKLVIVGDGACGTFSKFTKRNFSFFTLFYLLGKTCLLYAFSKNEFPETWTPTVFETDYKDIEVDGKIVKNLLKFFFK